MPPFKPIKRKDLIKGELRLILPNPHQSEISKDLLARILHQANLTREEWEKLYSSNQRRWSQCQDGSSPSSRIFRFAWKQVGLIAIE